MGGNGKDGADPVTMAMSATMPVALSAVPVMLSMQAVLATRWCLHSVQEHAGSDSDEVLSSLSEMPQPLLLQELQCDIRRLFIHDRLCPL